MAIRYPIFHYVPDFATPPELTHTAKADLLRLGGAPAFMTWPDTRVESLMVINYSLTGQLDLTTAKGFISALGGQCKPFILPTWLRDFTVSITPTVGGTFVQVDVDDYQAAYLTETADDQEGRFVYCYDMAQTPPLHVARVIRSTAGVDPGTSALEIEQPMPWTPATTALWGFARIVRLADDTVQVTQFRPDRGSFELKALTCRLAAYTDESEVIAAADSVDVEASLRFATATIEHVDAPKLRFDYAHADGPLNLHFVQAEQYTVRWCAWLGSTQVRLGKYEEGDVWPPSDNLGSPSMLFPEGKPVTDHVSLAFDQNSWEVIAYQRTATTIAIRRRFNGVLVEHEFEGVSPALAFNGVLNLQAVIDGVSDVMCYYTRPGFGCIFVRVQRDNFADEYVAVAGPKRVHDLVTSDRDGKKGTIEFIADDFRLVTVRTDEYPDPPEVHTLFVAGDFIENAGVGLIPSGEYFEIIRNAFGDDQGGVAVDMLGDYSADIFGPDPIMERAGAGLSLTGNAEQMVIPRSVGDRETVALRVTGLYFDAIRSSGVTTDTSGVSLSVSGTYAP